LTPSFPDSGVEKCSFTVVNSAFSPCYQENWKQSEQLQLFFGRVLSSYNKSLVYALDFCLVSRRKSGI
ncbi:MAG: hypothetical protein Q9M26_05900, partial [Mariprofundales bacterium]|nr:hypothetical protein [Mariprofundales bacterium]